MKLYLAYGANTNFTNMSERCPDARYICNVTLHDFRLVFRGVADVVPSRNGKVVCAMWAISAEDEKALDAFEGFPRAYVKRYVTLTLRGRRHRVMFYVMRNPRGEYPPYPLYEACLREGYEHCGMPQAQITKAATRAERSAAQRTDGWRPRSRNWDPQPPVAPVITDDALDAATEERMEAFYDNLFKQGFNVGGGE